MNFHPEENSGDLSSFDVFERKVLLGAVLHPDGCHYCGGEENMTQQKQMKRLAFFWHFFDDISKRN